MKYLFTFLMFLAIQNLPAIAIDSLQRNELIRQGRSELCATLDKNENAIQRGQLGEMNFVIVLDGNENPIDYTLEKHIDSANVPILESATVDSINKYLRNAYTQYHIEMYMIIIKSLDIIVSTPLPVFPTAKQLFQQKLYDEESNVAAMRTEHVSITNAIINSTFSIRNRNCLIYSRAVYKGVVVASEKSGTWTFSKTLTHTASPSTFSYTNELQSYFYDRIKDNTQVTQGGFEYSLRTVAKEFYESAKYIDLKSSILTTYTATGLSIIFDTFNEQIDYENLSAAERRHALSVYSGYPMFDNMFSHEEQTVLKLIRHTPPQGVAGLLYDLSSSSPLKNSELYEGRQSDSALIVLIIFGMNDAFLPGQANNYAELMQVITTLMLSNENVVQTYLPQNDQQWLDRSMYWDDNYWVANAPVGCHDYDIVLMPNGTVNVSKSVVDRHDLHYTPQGVAYYTEHWDPNYADQNLNPFALVAFTNRSEFGMLQVAGAGQNEICLAPAIFLKYASDKTLNANAIKITAIVVDLIAIATGPGLIVSAIDAGCMALAAFEALQFIGSGLNLVANSSLSPEFNEAVQFYNTIVGGWGISRITTSGAKYTLDYVSAVRSGDVHAIPTMAAQNYIAKFDAITNWEGVSESVKSQMKRMRDLLGKSVRTATEAIANNPYKSDWSKWSVLAYAKGSRPSPSSYLKLDHLTAHANKFSQQGGSFIVVKSWLEGGQFNNFPIAKFVMLRSEMESLISEYRSTHNLSVLEEGLGYDPGALTGLENELFVFHLDNTKFTFEMPSGNETGANDLWEPSGITSGGKSEAVVYDKISRNSPIQHNKSLNYLQGQFENQKIKTF